MNFKEKEIDGCHYYEIGKGSSLYILLSGWGTPYSLADMYNLAMLLSSDSRVIIIDRIGYNRTDRLVSERTFNNVCNEISSIILAEVSEEKAIIVGHSQGGAYALFLALEYPQLVKSIVTLDMLPYTGRYSSIFYSLNYIPGYLFRVMRVTKALTLISDSRLSNLLRLHSVPASIKVDALRRTRESLYNKNVMNELKYTNSFIKRIKLQKDSCDVPIVMIISETTEKMTKKSVPKIMNIFNKTQIFNIGKSSHYVHHDKEYEVCQIIVSQT